MTSIHSAPPAPPRHSPARDDQATALRALVREVQRTAPHTTVTEPTVSQKPRRARTLAIASGKGGVGKTTLAVNLAAAFALREISTTLLDGDLGLGNADLLLGLSARTNLAHVITARARLEDAVIETPAGFRLVPASSGVARLADLPDYDHAAFARAVAQLQSSASLLLIDCGAGIGRAVLSSIAAADHTIVVTTPEPTAIADAYALIKCVITRARATASNRSISLLVNQCTAKDQGQAVHARVAAVTDRFLQYQIPLAGSLPHDNAIVDSVRARALYVTQDPEARTARRILSLAASLAGTLELSPSWRRKIGAFLRREPANNPGP